LESQNLAPGVLAIVSGEAITLEDLPAYLKFRLQLRPTIIGLIRDRLVAKACEALQIEADEDELDNYVDTFRENKKLFTVPETTSWLANQDMTYDDLCCLCEWELKLGKLKERIAEGQLEKSFAFRKLDLDGVELYRIVMPDEVQVMEILTLLNEGADFFGLARTYSEDQVTRLQCGYMGVVRRKELRPEVEACVFAAKEGSVAGPVRSLGDYHLYRVERFYPARLEGETRTLLLDEIFEQWMQRQIAAADIQLFTPTGSLQDDYND